MKAKNLSLGDKVKVNFTDAVCTVGDIDYSYGRTSISLSYFNGTTPEVTIISGHKEVKLIKD